MRSEGGGSAAVVGDECHIVGKTPDSARYRIHLSVDIDSYKNLIVLCKTHHKQIDDQSAEYTEERLISIKQAHEQWVRATLDAQPEQCEVDSSNEVVTLLPRITSGNDLIGMLQGSHAYSFNYDQAESEDESELVASFCQCIQDWGDILGDLDAGEVVRAGFKMNELLRDLESQGFIVFGERSHGELRVGEMALQGDVLSIAVIRESNPSILRATSRSGNPS